MNTMAQPTTTASDVSSILPYSAKRISSTAWVNGLKAQT